MMTFLEQKGISSDTLSKLKQYIQGEEFDTDSIYLDIEKDSDLIGNIAKKMHHENVMSLIRHFMESNMG